MSLKTLIIAAGSAALAFGLATAAPAQDPAPDASALYETRCKFCHETGAGGAPERAHLAALPKPKIVEVLTTGVMADMAADLSEAQIDALATYLATPAAAPEAAPDAAPDAVPAPAPAPETPAAPPAV